MIKNKRGWIKIVEAFIAVFIIMSVAIFVINKSYIERRDISEKIYGVEIQLLQEIIDKFGNIKFNDINSPDEMKLDDFIYGEGDITKSRVPEYLDCGIRICPPHDINCQWVSKEPEKQVDIYVQTLPIVETDTSLRIECWIKQGGYSGTDENEENLPPEICKRIFGDADTDKAMNIYFVGAGYDENQVFCQGECDLNNFDKILENDINRMLFNEDENTGYGLLTIEPFASNLNRINIFMVTESFDYDYVNNPVGWGDGYYFVEERCSNLKIINPVHVIIGFDDASSGSGGSGALTSGGYRTGENIKQIHELGHNLGLEDNYGVAYGNTIYKTMYDSTPVPNCDNTPGCPKWCNGLPLSPPPDVNCIHYSTEQECNNHAQGQDCLWLLVPDPYFNSQCIKNRNIPGDPNLGTECLDGTGCYWGCSGYGYRPVPGGNFASMQTQGIDEQGKHIYEPVSERFINEMLDCCYPNDCDTYDYDYCNNFAIKYSIGSYSNYGTCNVCAE